MPLNRPRGMAGFSIVWFGQLVSLMGTNMTGFGVTIWAYEKTGSATALSLLGFFFVAPMLIFSPFAGAIVDRYNRKLMMMVSDLASGLATIIILILLALGKLEIWHLYITSAFQGLFQGFQWPAYSAAITTMLPKAQYGRANGLMSLVETAPGIFAPLMAGTLISMIGLVGILWIDVITFTFAIGALLLVNIPNTPVTEEGKKGQGNLLKEASYGFWYILKRPSLLGLQIVFLIGNFFVSIPAAIYAALILARSGNDEIVFGTVNTVGAVGGLVGGLVMSAWGGPKRRVHGVLAGWALSGVLGTTLMGFGRGLVIWGVASFLTSFMIPIINGSNQAIWQSKVAPDIQGRVFSIRRLIAWFVSPLAMLIAGPLADKVMEPAMQSGGRLAALLEPLVGSGKGSGISVIFVVGGIFASLVGLGGYLVPVIRDAESILPDHDASPVSAESMPESAG